VVVSDGTVQSDGSISVWGFETVGTEEKVTYVEVLFGHLPVVTEENKENVVIRGCATDIKKPLTSE
jgi:hypothetical protein